MLDLVDVGTRSLDAYRGIAPDIQLEKLREAARGLHGARVLHVNATPYGGGVSEVLRSVIPILNDLGLVADWRIISGDDAFFQVTKVMHNGLQGAARSLTQAEKDIYLANSRSNAKAFREEYDFIFVDDPQPAALLSMRGKGHAHWVWRCHIDTSAPNPEVWRFLRPFLEGYDAAIFTMEDFIPAGMPVSRVEVIPPAIDPLSPKNISLAPHTAREVLEWIGVRLDQPLVTQVSRFDPWKDPFGVIAAYRMARDRVPDLQLALVGAFALDDPEGWQLYRQLIAETKVDRNVHLFTNLLGVGNIEVNAFQAMSNVVIQKSIREGFGLVVSEAMWKGTPVVAGRAGGIPLQMADGVGGILVDTVDQCAEALVALLENPARAKELGVSGRERVREHFLMPRLVLNHLTLMTTLARGKPFRRGPEWFRQRDPVCGMTVDAPGAPTTKAAGVEYLFCSEACRNAFRANPRRYAHRPGPESHAP
ncbi:MAG: glycosyltransferase [Myxococcota bacterium]